MRISPSHPAKTEAVWNALILSNARPQVICDCHAGSGEGTTLACAEYARLTGAELVLSEKDPHQREKLREKYPHAKILSRCEEVPAYLGSKSAAIIDDPCGYASSVLPHVKGLNIKVLISIYGTGANRNRARGRYGNNKRLIRYGTRGGIRTDWFPLRVYYELNPLPYSSGHGIYYSLIALRAEKIRRRARPAPAAKRRSGLKPRRRLHTFRAGRRKISLAPLTP